ncbi:MAG: ubiquitin-activating E1 FCCH domain-containing protein, partial [Candidatus Poseidoniales archaeon]
MARSAPAFSSFTAGEISPKLEGRTNIEKYREGLSDLTNMVVMPHGGVTRRPGTEYLGETADSSVKSRLISFQFKTADTYILEFGDQTMRVFRNDLQVLSASPATITGATQADPVVVTTSGAHGFSNGDEVFIDSVAGMTEINARNYLVQNVTSTTFDLRFAQSADTMYIVHPNYDVRTLTRTDHNAWKFATIILEGGLASAQNITAITQANPGVITITGHNYSDGDAVKIESIVGMTELNDASYYVANATTNTFSLQNEAGEDIDTTSFTAYSSGGTAKKVNQPTQALTGSDNRPSVVSFFEQRLVFGNTNNNPQTLWFSKNGDYQNFTVGTADDD